jgi:hypothetical protein
MGLLARCQQDNDRQSEQRQQAEQPSHQHNDVDTTPRAGQGNHEVVERSLGWLCEDQHDRHSSLAADLLAIADWVNYDNWQF